MKAIRSATLIGVFSFCRPSRGPTSTIWTRSLMPLDHGHDARFHTLDRQVETAALRRRCRENELVFADRYCRRSIAISKRHLLFGALPLAERKYPLPLPDRHPAERLPRRVRFLARGLLFVVHDGSHRRTKFEIAQRT